jgi:hypothetical protein
LRVGAVVIVRPGLWAVALGTLRRLARPEWWRRPPFLPVPDAEYWHFRMVTAYGGEGDARQLSGSDVVAYLRWCQRMRNLCD